MLSTRDELTRERRAHPSGDVDGVEVGHLVDGLYRVRRLIGSGGMGLVVEAEGVEDGRPYALKFCRLGGSALKRFAREIRLMARIRHPHVVPVVAANLDAPTPYFVMPLALNSLRDELPRLAGNETETLSVFRQVCLGVQAIHDCGIVHRDIKPANVLRLRNGRVAVTDLGVAKLETRDSTVLTKSRAVVGTLAYLAPEQMLPQGSRLADIRTDVFQLGKVLYQLLTGLPPVIIEPALLPKGLAHIIQRATSTLPDDRYQDLGEFLDALRYFQLAKDPSRNSREALENLVVQAETRLHRGTFAGEGLREILALLDGPDHLGASAMIERFDRLPDALLPFLVSHHPAEFQPVLRGYADALRERVSGFRFGYADALARRMRQVFHASESPGVKVLALLTTLIAAVELNRFTAMHAFNRLLMSLTTVEFALPVAEMLRNQSRYYAEVARGAPPDRLHPAIRDVQRELLTTSDLSF